MISSGDINYCYKIFCKKRVKQIGLRYVELFGQNNKHLDISKHIKQNKENVLNILKP